MIDIRCNVCNLGLRVSDGFVFDCPNCGSVLDGLSEKKRVKYIRKLEKLKNGVDEKDLEEVLKKEQRNKELLRKLGFYELLSKLEHFYVVLRSPDEDMTNKLIAAAVLGYIFSPINIVGNFAPGIGQLDDFAIIAIGMSLMNLNNRSNVSTIYKNIKKLVYLVVPSYESVDVNYYENSDFRVFTITELGFKSHGLEVIGCGLIKTHQAYLPHPYLRKILVPIEQYNELVMKDRFSEEMAMFVALGAKKVHVETHIFESKSKKFKIDENSSLIRKYINGEVEVEGSKITHKKLVSTREIGNPNIFNEDMLNDILWYFTNESEFKDIVNQRITHNISRLKHETELYSDDYLSTKIQAKLVKFISSEYGFDVKNESKHIIKYDVEFYSNTEVFDQSESSVLDIVRERLQNRKKQLAECNNAYLMIN